MAANDRAEPKRAEPRWFHGSKSSWEQSHVLWSFELPHPERYKEILTGAIAPALDSLGAKALHRFGFEYGELPGCSLSKYFFLTMTCPLSGDYRKFNMALRRQLRAPLENGMLKSVDTAELMAQFGLNERQRMRGHLLRYKGLQGLRVYRAFRGLDGSLILRLVESGPREWTAWRTELLVDIIFLQEALGIAPSRRLTAIAAWLRHFCKLTEPVKGSRSSGKMRASIASGLRRDADARRMTADLQRGNWRGQAGSRRQAFLRYWPLMRGIGTKIARLPGLPAVEREHLIHHSYIHSHLLANGIDSLQEKVLYTCLLG